MSKELWKPIYGTNDYFVSNIGRIKHTKKGYKKLYTTKKKDTKKYVYLYKVKEKFTKFID